ncbi:hypothetical protein MNBD_GAMMA26-2564 [hydrothermal vent metagenome]|uniref:Uncharacterized protein n=1 Tax=hydrothermal vent metagenome TaxID=652676 RepID=A0A3B1BK77_9ZZZZ
MPTEDSRLKQCLQLIFVMVTMLCVPSNVVAGGACVVAKAMGNSEAIEWVFSLESAETALQQAGDKLRQRGYKYFFPQAVVELQHAYVIILRSDYQSSRGRDRTSYGCGFSAVSYDEALWAALKNLQSYAWGWKSDREGYKIVTKARY